MTTVGDQNLSEFSDSKNRYAKLILHPKTLLASVAVLDQYRDLDRERDFREVAKQKRLAALRRVMRQKSSLRRFPIETTTDNVSEETTIDSDNADMATTIRVSLNSFEETRSKRGRICGLGPGAGRRMRWFCKMVDPDVRAFAVTLTYPDESSPHPKEYHKHLKSFRKALNDVFGHICGIWRLEYEIRNTGKNAGQCVGHFHLLLYFKKYPTYRLQTMSINKIQQECRRAWHRIAGKGDPKHAKVGVHVALLDTPDSVSRWLIYLTKEDVVDVAAYCPNGTGKVWGTWMKGDIPMAPEVEFDLNEAQYNALFQYIKKQLGPSAKDVTYAYALRCILKSKAALEKLLEIMAEYATPEESDTE